MRSLRNDMLVTLGDDCPLHRDFAGSAFVQGEVRRQLHSDDVEPGQKCRSGMSSKRVHVGVDCLRSKFPEGHRRRVVVVVDVLPDPPSEDDILDTEVNATLNELASGREIQKISPEGLKDLDGFISVSAILRRETIKHRRDCNRDPDSSELHLIVRVVEDYGIVSHTRGRDADMEQGSCAVCRIDVHPGEESLILNLRIEERRTYEAVERVLRLQVLQGLDIVRCPGQCAHVLM